MIASRVAATLQLRPERMKDATTQGFLTATDLADELVRRGVPFAEAHEQVGKLVSYCAAQGRTFAGLSAAEARRFIPSWDEPLRRVAVSPEKAVDRRNVTGGTAPRQVARQIAAAETALRNLKNRIYSLTFDRAGQPLSATGGVAARRCLGLAPHRPGQLGFQMGCRRDGRGAASPLQRRRMHMPAGV